ncbi:protein UNUSUAL FLORAL ORGANS-like [Euphorbia lathyris]|uniref:protein UNUSUAL FLORAL ORGANS-like n=1 Tax=Euphorbia lathyris TaxID=212925 RepID=UPI003313B874
MEAFAAAAIPLPFPYTIPWMDSRIWRKLPQKLLERVIAFLPPPAFFRARAVCKRWYSLLFSNHFLQLYIHISPRRPWFLFFKHKTLKSYIYSSNTNALNRTNFQGYLFDPYDFVWYQTSFPQIPSGFSPAASSGGLICWVSDDAGPKSLLLSNPLIGGSVSQLPLTLRPRLFPSIGLVVGLSSIDISVAGDDLISQYAVKNISTESFHIDAGGFYSLWGTTSSLPRLCSLESGEMIFAGGKFYCMNYNPYSVLAYEITSNKWLKIQAPMRRFLRSPSLVESEGKLILVAAVKKSKLNVPKTLRLWSLQSCGRSWAEIERMPQQLYVQFSEVEDGKGFNCVGHGEFIIIIIRESDKCLLFDICRKRWEWIPPCPYVHGSFSNGGEGEERELHGFAYDPRLAVPVTALLDHFQSFTGLEYSRV